MKQIILLILSIFVYSESLFGQGNPLWLQESWRMEVNPAGSESNQIDSYWRVGGELYVLLNTPSRSILTNGHEIVWQTEQHYDYIKMVDFQINEGKGIILRSGNQIEYHYGDDFSNVLSTFYTEVNYPDEGWRTNYASVSIFPALGDLPDSSRQIIVSVTRSGETDWNGFPPSFQFKSDGVFHLLSFSDESDSVFTAPYSPQSGHSIPLEGGGNRTLYIGHSTVGSGDEHGPNANNYCGMSIFDYSNGEITFNSLGLDNYKILKVSMMRYIEGGDSRIFAGLINDSYNSRLVRIDPRTLRIENSLRCDYINSKRWFIIRDPQTGDEHILLYSDSPHFQLIRLDGYIEKNFLWTPLDENLADVICCDADDDSQDELLVLTEKNLILYEIRALQVSDALALAFPTTLSLSAFPNPFNTSTTISYSLPAPGRYAIDVIDIQGRLVARLADEWQEAGSYREVWNARETSQGIFFARISGVNSKETVPILLLK